MDFGLARQTGSRTVTVTGTSLGTPRYMSPEQFMDSKTVGPASDVWAVGVMMYEALTEVAPFDAPSPHAMMLKILMEPHVPLTVRLPGCPSRLAALIDRCLEKEPGERPSDARAVRSLFLGAYAAISGG
ncbi:MAG: protein kinase, partial [Myxococcales bacterium]|nr:protein kinase [Myxococcales bacterium]